MFNLKKDISILILAAGTSKRLGEPKQLLKYREESLIVIAVKKALELSSIVTVVLGHNATTMREEIKDFPITIVVNPKYNEGIGSSVSFGIQENMKYKNTLIMLCDQPFIPISHYLKLINSLENNSLIGSFYNDCISVPAIFSQKYYFSLQELKGDKGAKSILIKENAPTVKLENEFAIDIDTLDDIKYLL